MIGKTLSHYRIEEELGRGGMGVVYKAEDTKLDRTVAIKVLPSAALASEDDRARFYREAKAAAQLHHPHIASVFEIDEAVPEGSNTDDLRPFIAMEYIAGETLSEFIKKSPLKLTEAVNIASQVAEALKAAHAKEIVHRDIKSANVMLTEDGVAKVLDFGLAKTNQSTMLTRMGSTLGTIAYMSPEQARGQEVDGRSDLYSLGTMLYEMIAGRLPFGGDYEQAVVYGILNETPEPLTAVRTGVPMGLEWIVNKLLSKDAEYRYQTAADLLADLKSVDLSGSGHSTRSVAAMSAAQVSAAPDQTKAAIPKWVWGVVVVAILTGMGIGMTAFGSGETSMPPTQFIVELVERTAAPDMSWSADNRSIFYTAEDSAGQNQYVRRYSLDTGLSEIVPGTEGAVIAQASPDGRWLIIRDGNENRLERLAITGGQATPIPRTEGSVAKVAVGANGDVYFTTPDFSLAAVSEDGALRIVAHVDSLVTPALANVWPTLAPNSNKAFWSSWLSITTSVESWAAVGDRNVAISQLYVLQSILGNGLAIVVPTGAIGESSSVISFDAVTGQTSGAPVPFSRLNSWARSAGGDLIIEESATSQIVTEGESLYEIRSDGSTIRLGSVPGISNDFTISNDGKSIVIESRQASDSRRDLYVFDVETQTVTRLTRTRHNENPYWSSDDEFIYFDQHEDGVPGLARRRSDASSPLEVLTSDSTEYSNPALSPDGSYLVFATGPASDPDLFLLDLESGEQRMIASGPAYQTDADFSPNGDYIVYRSGDLTEGSIVVISIDGSTEIEITNSGGFPVWSPQGDYIYYMKTLRSLYRVPITTEGGFRLTGTEELVHRVPNHMHFDLMQDGRVIISQPNRAANASTQMRVILNFDEYARRLMGER